VNKKKQKNFIDLGRAGRSATGTGSSLNKSFCAAFFQKAATFFDMPWPLICPRRRRGQQMLAERGKAL
jgi:hypothetical protein